MTTTPAGRYSRLLPVADVADYLACSRRTVLRLIARGELPAIRLGTGKTTWRITEQAVFDFAVKFGDLNPTDLTHVLTFDEEGLPLTTTPAGRARPARRAS